MLSEWDKEDGWKRLDHGMDIISRWMLVIAIGGLLIQLALSFL